jgi:hypothetical protein
MIEQELEMLKIGESIFGTLLWHFYYLCIVFPCYSDQFGKIDSYHQHRQSTVSNSNLYPVMQSGMNNHDTPFALRTPMSHSRSVHQNEHGSEVDARNFLNQFTTRHTDHGQSYSASPVSELFTYQSTPWQGKQN